MCLKESFRKKMLEDQIINSMCVFPRFQSKYRCGLRMSQDSVCQRLRTLLCEPGHQSLILGIELVVSPGLCPLYRSFNV
jgi:hypothetical protein